MSEEEYKKIVETITNKIKNDVELALTEMGMSFRLTNLSNGTAEAVGLRFGDADMSDFIFDLLTDVSGELSKEFTSQEESQ